MKAVVIEQSEIISPLGNLIETVTDLIDGAKAIIPGPCFDVPVAYAPFLDTQFRDLAFCTSWLGSHINLTEIDPSSTIFIYSAAKGDIRAIEEKNFSGTISTNISPLLDLQTPVICELLKFTPARKIVVSNACASGAVGIETALELLRMERYSHAVIFGFDCLSRFTTTGFYSLGALSDTGARPFDAQRNGLTMGEGAAITVISYREAYKGDIIVIGAGSSNDANHRTGPSRTGEGLFRSAQAAIKDASITHESIGAVKCHGTATIFNDAMEAKALYSLFDDNCPPCSSFKGAIGHLSGASSLVEILITAECIKRRILPPTIGYENHGVDEQITLSSKTQSIENPTVLCLAAGFSGLNTSVIIKECA